VTNWLAVLTLPALLAVYVPTCVPNVVAPTETSGGPPLAELWDTTAAESPSDLFSGPWGPERAPDPDAVYEFVEPKRGGVNPGMTVRDPLGREWKVKQPPLDGRRAEGPVEVVLSRVLSACGYHQPPVYYLPVFTLRQHGQTRTVPGGRFRLTVPALRDTGDWSWQRNPFVGTRPYQGLLVILLMFNSSDLKNANNTLYEYRPEPGRRERWYVVRDLGTALGSTGRITPVRSDPAVFERLAFIRGVERGFVRFDYHGWHQELVRDRITPADVRWASALVGRLTPQDWDDAFRAGGYEPAVRARFIARLREKVDEGRALGLEAEGP
jgi:hypothetical protein